MLKKFSAKFNAKGFTLIELLVVVAIIAILSTAVLVSLNSARAKARDARVKSEMQQLKSAMELYYNNFGGYSTAPMSSVATGTGCSGSGGNTFGVTASDGPGTLASAIVADGTSPSCGANKDSWAFSVALPGGGNWCVDSNGKSSSGTASITGSTFQCP